MCKCGCNTCNKPTKLTNILKEITQPSQRRAPGTSIRKLYIEAKRMDPHRLADLVADTVEGFLTNLEKFGSGNYVIDEKGIEFISNYSSYYQQDDNWYSYGDLKINKSMYDSKDITQCFKGIRQDIKERQMFM